MTVDDAYELRAQDALTDTWRESIMLELEPPKAFEVLESLSWTGYVAEYPL